MEKVTKWLFQKLRLRDSRTIEIYFDLLSVWWLFVLWSPDASLALDITNTLFAYIIGALAGCVLAISFMTLFTKKLQIRLAVLISYFVFYFLTGVSLLFRQPPNILGGFFICQSILATFLLWKLRVRYE